MGGHCQAAFKRGQQGEASCSEAAPQPGPSHTCGQLLEDGGLEGGGPGLANLGRRHIPPSDRDLGSQVGASGGGGGGQLLAIPISLCTCGGGQCRQSSAWGLACLPSGAALWVLPALGRRRAGSCRRQEQRRSLPGDGCGRPAGQEQ